MPPDKVKNPGNGALELLIEMFGVEGATFVLAHMWARGFKVVPVVLADLEE